MAEEYYFKNVLGTVKRKRITVINAFKRRAEKYRIDLQIEMVHRVNKVGNIKSMSRQAIIDIVSKSWDEVSNDIIKTSFQLTGSYGCKSNGFLNHKLSFKKKLLDKL